MAYKKMTVIPARAGVMYECYYCKTILTPPQADNHSCSEE